MSTRYSGTVAILAIAILTTAIGACRSPDAGFMANLSKAQVAVRRDKIPARRVQLDWTEYRNDTDEHYGTRFVTEVAPNLAIEVGHDATSRRWQSLGRREPRRPRRVRNEVFLYWDEIDGKLYLELFKDGSSTGPQETPIESGQFDLGNATRTATPATITLANGDKAVQVKTVAFGITASFLVRAP